MSYTDSNKEAWEEAFDKRKAGWGEKNAEMLRAGNFPFLSPEMIETVKQFDFSNRKIAQFCCNNGRELMSIVKGTRAAQGIGFDIADNIVAAANKNAEEVQIPCDFLQCDILRIPEKYHDSFDCIVILIGALCWFENLKEFFKQVSLCLKKDGILIIHEIHPFTDMLAVPGDEVYDENNPQRIIYSYFRKEPFIDCFGMLYLSGKEYESKPFTSFSHTLGDVVTSIIENELDIMNLKEFDVDVSGNNTPLSGKGIPLSYILVAKK